MCTGCRTDACELLRSRSNQDVATGRMESASDSRYFALSKNISVCGDFKFDEFLRGGGGGILAL